MTWYAVYRDSDGVLVSEGTVLAKELPKGLVAVEVAADRPQAGPSGLVWSPKRRSFDTAPVAKGALSLKEFLDRFTPGEREVWWKFSADGDMNKKYSLGSFRSYLDAAGAVDLGDPYVVNAVQSMESAGVLAAGRAVEILA